MTIEERLFRLEEENRILRERLRKYPQAFLSFLEDLRLDFDNHQAEQDVRIVKL